MEPSTDTGDAAREEKQHDKKKKKWLSCLVSQGMATPRRWPRHHHWIHQHASAESTHNNLNIGTIAASLLEKRVLQRASDKLLQMTLCNCRNIPHMLCDLTVLAMQK